jgi:Ca2+-binding RTX toxin-like protein
MARQGSIMEWCLVPRSQAEWDNTRTVLYELFQDGIPDNLLASKVFNMDSFVSEKDNNNLDSEEGDDTLEGQSSNFILFIELTIHPQTRI